ncbi:hypothetical protein MAY82_09390 [Edwardsiella ictaluri]|nr:hypothetical protein [Edwardsiella ictaluri]WFO14437.1 hypothetical protein MAY82_09390 [Edwardsiella ictaluri]
MTAEQLQSYLMQRTVVDSPDAWPEWLITLALAWLGLCALLILHALLHRRLRPLPAVRSGAEHLYLYPRTLRLWHLLNALLFLFLLFSGLLLHAVPLPWRPPAGWCAGIPTQVICYWDCGVVLSCSTRWAPMAFTTISAGGGSRRAVSVRPIFT